MWACGVRGPERGRHPQLQLHDQYSPPPVHHTTPQQASFCFGRRRGAVQRKGKMDVCNLRSFLARLPLRHLAQLPLPLRFTDFSRMLVVIVVLVFVDVIIRNVPGATAANLTCYSCITFDENNVCYANVSAAPQQRCNKAATACSVYREDVAGKFIFVVRGCNSSCVQKCGVWGTVRDIDKCSSCCDTDLCNVDDAAFTPRTVTMTFWAMVFSPWVLAKLIVGAG